jgi:hypothetical protein
MFAQGGKKKNQCVLCSEPVRNLYRVRIENMNRVGPLTKVVTYVGYHPKGCVRMSDYHGGVVEGGDV